jgi:hypothetical protein
MGKGGIMRPRGLYVVEAQKVFDGNSVVYAKLSTVYEAVNDKLIEKAKGIAKECELSEFAIINVDAEHNTHLLYMHG